MQLDKSVLQIFANYCVSAAESMAYTLVRTAHSTFVKETEDFSCAIMTPDGLTFASPKTLGATWYVGLDYGSVIRMIDDYAPGDVCMTNDAYSGFVATHTPDIVIWKPVYYGDEIVCFVGGHIHNTDMGGAVPASLSRTLTEIQQEGVRFPPCKIARAGVVDDALVRIMATNVRAPEQNVGDLLAQLASLHTGERRVLEIVERFGLDGFKAGMRALLDYSEEQARTILRGIPDGDYGFAEYADEDSVNGKPMRVALTARIRGGEVEMDYSGSDPQLQSSLNMPTGGHERHALALVGLVYVLYTLNPDILLNTGMLRVARCVLPEGSVVNAAPPAAVGMRSLTCKLLHLLTFGAFARAVPERLAACPAGGLSILSVKTMSREGETVMASIGPIGGGAGGSATDDGEDGSGANNAFLRNTPVEINEAEVPIRITRYGVAPGSGGAGQYRGGQGLVMEFQVFAPNTLVTARNRDRTRFASWGLDGGLPGGNARFTRNPDTPQAEALDNNDLVVCAPGDVIRLVGAGAGGYGRPIDREPAKVRDDVLRGYVSADVARDVYGVALDGDEVDVEQTAALRDAARERLAGEFAPAFSFGTYREAFEAKWTRARYAALTRILTGVPVPWRYFIKHRLFDALDARIAVDPYGCGDGGGEIVDVLFAELCRAYPQLTRAA
ncbi:hydantoin utilization protein B [Burkholderia mayonis]|uniref:Hydantoin utilization protein B n=1 Tax=Burkholderia mayonis TaxID=1385591 RepID=A0A1B4FJG7_9BURK|nr:hydantoinase B/oxoprolinase family protein [Burkholderia mayonis]AOJ03810.1 hydantoin utilization protein B [Burkholderia mayonis]KVE42535.1 hydantoin utilization protein B [Burkholderia mayonis]